MAIRTADSITTIDYNLSTLSQKWLSYQSSEIDASVFPSAVVITFPNSALMSAKKVYCLLAVLCCVQPIFGLTIVSKQQWGGRVAKNTTALADNLTYAIVHHTAGKYCRTNTGCIAQLKNIQDYHMDSLGWDDIGYNFLIGGDGNVYEGRGWNVVGAHALHWNLKSMGIAFLGNYNTDRIATVQIMVAHSLLAAAVDRGQISADYILYGHRQVGTTECPGTNIWNEIKTWSHWKS